jgi:hypothetical protein
MLVDKRQLVDSWQSVEIMRAKTRRLSLFESGGAFKVFSIPVCG